jgi:Spy/CpxP family protein refolding chaperone
MTRSIGIDDRGWKPLPQSKKGYIALFMISSSFMRGGKMKTKILLITGAITFAIFIGSLVYAGGMGGGMGGGMMGGGMGGGGMMGSGQGYSSPWQNQNPYNNNRSDQKAYRDNARETEKLREEIREKRNELHALYRAEKPNPDRIEKKIDELSRLEAELDQKMLSR